MTSVISHPFSLVLYHLAGILSVDDFCIFEYVILASAATDVSKSWCSEKQVPVDAG